MKVKSSKFIISVWTFIFLAIISMLLIKPINQTIGRFDRKAKYAEILQEEMQRYSDSLRSKGLYGDSDHIKLRLIRQSFLFLWNSYRAKAWGHDVLHDEYMFEDSTHQAQSMVSSIQTLDLMGLKTDVAEVNKHFKRIIPHAKGSVKLSTYFGQVVESFISSYEQIEEKQYLEIAKSLLNDINDSVFDGTDMLAYSNNNLFPSGNPVFNIHEYSSLFLCMVQLYKHTGTKSFLTGSLRILDKLLQSNVDDLFLNTYSKQDNNGVPGYSSFDSNGYSIYDSMIKLNILTNNSLPSLRKYVDNIFELVVENYLEYRGNSAYIVGYNQNIQENIVTLDSFLFAGLIKIRRDMNPEDSTRYNILAEKLMNGLFEYLNINPCGLPPRSAVLSNTLEPHDNVFDFDNRILELLLILYRTTRDNKYRDAAWRIFKAVNEHCRTFYGFAPVSINNSQITQIHKEVDPKIFSGFFKLMYLIFSDTAVADLDKFVITGNGNYLKIWENPEMYIDSEVFEDASRLSVL